MGHLEPLRLTGTPDEITAALAGLYPPAVEAPARARVSIKECLREVAPHEACALAYLAHCLNGPGARFLEIGTALGFTAAVMASAAPDAYVTTLNPKSKEFGYARWALMVFPNVTALCVKSWDYLATYDGGPALSLVFIDGDHGQAARDIAWWEYLAVGGLLLFHDYSLPGCGRPCQPVYETVVAFQIAIGRAPDVLIDAQGVGMAGWVKRKWEVTPRLDERALSWHFSVELHDWVRDDG